MAMHPAPVVQRFQSVLGWLKVQRQTLAAIAAITAAILILILIGPFTDELSQQLARVLSEFHAWDLPLGLWTLSYIGNLLLALFYAVVMTFENMATNVFFVPLLAAIGIAWLAAK